MSQRRFADTGDVFDQEMPACEQTYDGPFDHLRLSLDDALDVRLEQSYFVRRVQRYRV